MREYDVLTFLDTCADLIVDLGETVPEFDQKEKLVRDFGLYMGGSACIFASQCAKLQLSTVGVGVVGEDSFGGLVRETLRESGVDTSYLTTDSAVKTSLGISLNRGTDRAILTYDQSIQAVNASMASEELLKKARHLHIASYYLLRNLGPGLEDLCARARRLGLTVSLDTNWDPAERWELPLELLRQVDVFLPNEREIRFLSGREDLEEAMAYFLRYVPVLAVKLGERGAVAATREERVSLPSRQVPVADTVGAGDSFDGGFLWGYLNGLGLEESLRAGILCGAGNVACFGGCQGQIGLKRLEKERTNRWQCCEEI